MLPKNLSQRTMFPLLKPIPNNDESNDMAVADILEVYGHTKSGLYSPSV